jgi:hypothetical protein
VATGRRGRRAELTDGLRELPRTWREVVSRTDVRRGNPVEVAADLGLDPGQERAIRNRPRAVLRERLARYPVTAGSTMNAATPRTLARRLAPLQVAMAMQGLILWVPVEKLFMSEIGFTPASVGVMAAAYAPSCPVRRCLPASSQTVWSRNRIMVLSAWRCGQLRIGGLSRTWRPTSSRRWSSAPTSP